MRDIGLTAGEQRTLARGFRPLTRFAEEYARLRSRGYTHREIAAEMGYGGGKKTVGRLASRARSLGLLPEPGREAWSR
jgi:hypothetical protein